jgi:hypothetical protein
VVVDDHAAVLNGTSTTQGRSTKFIRHHDLDITATGTRINRWPALSLADPVVRSEIYAKHGFWYDALRETWRLDNARASRGRLSLLADLVHLGMITEPRYPNYNPNQNQNQNQILQLRQIIKFEQMAQGSS